MDSVELILRLSYVSRMFNLRMALPCSRLSSCASISFHNLIPLDAAAFRWEMNCWESVDPKAVVVMKNNCEFWVGVIDVLKVLIVVTGSKRIIVL
jgi:hypothetical protein